MNKQEALDFINEYFTQDNHGTGYPIYFSIRDKKIVSCSRNDVGDVYQVVVDGETVNTCNTLEDVLVYVEEYRGISIPKDIKMYIEKGMLYFRDVEIFCSDNDIDLYDGIYEYEYKGMFLLKSEAELHLQQNKHHYSNDAIVYCHHAWRCERQKDFLESLRKILEE